MNNNDDSITRQNEPLILNYITGLEKCLLLFVYTGLGLLFFGGLLWVLDPTTKSFSQWMVYSGIPLFILSGMIFSVKSFFLFDPIRNAFFIQKQILSSKKEHFICSLKDIKSVNLIHEESWLQNVLLFMSFISLFIGGRVGANSRIEDEIHIQIVLPDNKKLYTAEHSFKYKGGTRSINFLIPLEELVDKAYTIASMAGCPMCCAQLPSLQEVVQEVVQEKQKKAIPVLDKCPSCSSALNEHIQFCQSCGHKLY